MRKLRFRDLPRAGSDHMLELDSQSMGSLPLTMAREVILPLHTHVLHSFSPHDLKAVACGDLEVRGAGDRQRHLYLLLRPPDD